MEDIESPCVRICCLDDNDICQGCYRSLEEIELWNELDNEDRATVIANTVKRQQGIVQFFKRLIR